MFTYSVTPTHCHGCSNEAINNPGGIVYDQTCDWNCWITMTNQKCHTLLEAVESAKVLLKVNIKKTNELESNQSLMFYYTTIKRVEKFLYLGSIINEDDGTNE